MHQRTASRGQFSPFTMDLVFELGSSGLVAKTSICSAISLSDSQDNTRVGKEHTLRNGREDRNYRSISENSSCF